MASEHDGDVFEDVLNLEEQYYSEGYKLGVADGSKSGRIEGRLFGLQKGFEKVIEMGKLNGRAAVWEARLPSEKSQEVSEHVAKKELPPVQGSDRLRKHIERLAALSDPDDLSTTNDEDAVSEFDDRLKDAKAKARLIERLVGEDENASQSEDANEQTRSGPGRALRVKKNEPSGAGRDTGEMEDFIGLPSR